MTTDKEPTRVKKLSVRVDEALRQQLQAAADHSLRSMNAEIIWRLRASLAEQAARP